MTTPYITGIVPPLEERLYGDTGDQSFTASATDPDNPGAVPIAWYWALTKPKGSTATYPAVANVVTLTGIDGVGSYRLFVWADFGGGRTTEQNPVVAPASAFARLVRMTQNLSLKLPASGQRDWADDVNDALLAIDLDGGDIGGHLDGEPQPPKHNARQIGYDRQDQDRSAIRGTSDEVLAALNDLDDAFGAPASTLATPTKTVVAAINETWAPIAAATDEPMGAGDAGKLLEIGPNGFITPEAHGPQSNHLHHEVPSATVAKGFMTWTEKQKLLAIEESNDAPADVAAASVAGSVLKYSRSDHAHALTEALVLDKLNDSNAAKSMGNGQVKHVAPPSEGDDVVVLWQPQAATPPLPLIRPIYVREGATEFVVAANETVAAGDIVEVQDAAGAFPACRKAGTTARNPIGVALTGGAAGAHVAIQTMGVVPLIVKSASSTTFGHRVKVARNAAGVTCVVGAGEAVAIETLGIALQSVQTGNDVLTCLVFLQPLGGGA